jgi:hypothetical protein
MTTTQAKKTGSRAGAIYSWLDQPLNGARCVIGWSIATMVFFGLVALFGGPTEADSPLTVYSTWAISHGHPGCAYAAFGKFHYSYIAAPEALVAPVYPILSGALAALAGFGHAVPFPTAAQLGPHCSSAFEEMYKWSGKARVIGPTIRIGYLSWFALMAGAIALLRASGRGRARWEPAALVTVACLPPVFACLVDYFHPQDLIAMGLALGSLAFILKDRWAWAGVLMGVAFSTNQFVLLMAAALFVIVPNHRRLRFVVGAIGAAIVIDLPVVVVSQGRALKEAIIGSGFSAGFGGTVLAHLNLQGPAQFVVVRVLPVAIAMGISWWALRRLGPFVLQPVPLLALMAISLSLRLLFEKSLFNYYFMAVAVMLLLLDVARGRIRGTMVAWLAFATLAFDPFPWPFATNGSAWDLNAREALPYVFLGIAALFIIFDALHRRFRWYLLAFFLSAALIFPKYPWMHEEFRKLPQVWVWQVILTPIAFLLAFWPLLEEIKRERLPKEETEGALST